MRGHDEKASLPGGKAAEKPAGEKNEPTETDNSCRCEEVSKKSFSQLLRLMAGDFAFWKKKK